MATLASLTVRLGIDTNAIADGARRAIRTLRTLGDDATGEGDRTGRGFATRMVLAMGRGIQSGIGSAFTNGLRGLQGALGGISSNPWVAGIGLALAATVVGTMLPAIAALLSAATVSVAGLAVIGVAAALLKDKPKVKSAAGDLKDTVGGILKKAAAPLEPAFVTALGSMKKTAQRLAPSIQAIFKSAAPLIPDLTKGIENFVTSVTIGVQNLLSHSKPTFDGLSDAISKIGLGLELFFTKLGQNPKATKLILEDLGTYIQVMIMVAGELISWLASAYVTVRSWAGNVVNAFKSVYNFVVVTIPKMIAQVVTWFASLPGRILGALSSFVSGVVSKFSSMSSRAYNATKSMVTNVVHFVAGLPGKAASALASLASKVYSKVYSAGSRMVSAAKSGVASAVSVVRGLPSKAASALSGIGSRLYNSGRALVGGFVNGIKSMISRVKNAVSSVVSAARRYFPFSPAKEGPFSGKGWTLYSGQSLVEGFADGIGKGAPGLRSQVDGVLGDVPGMAANVSGVVSAGRSQPQRVVIDVSGGDDEMRRMIRKWVRTTGQGNVQKAFG